jgi:hypothetical protein
MAKFKITGIKEPGRINAKLDGKFRDIDLFEASEEILAKLYTDKCPYIELTPSEFLERNPTVKAISIKPIKITKTKNE